MKKIEIIANLSVEEDIMNMLEEAGVKGFTKIPVVHGTGRTNPKMGDSVWPEENFMLIIYTDEYMVPTIKSRVKELKEKFHNEGIKYYAVEVEHL